MPTMRLKTDSYPDLYERYYVRTKNGRKYFGVTYIDRHGEFEEQTRQYNWHPSSKTERYKGFKNLVEAKKGEPEFTDIHYDSMVFLGVDVEQDDTGQWWIVIEEGSKPLVKYDSMEEVYLMYDTQTVKPWFVKYCKFRTWLGGVR